MLCKPVGYLMSVFLTLYSEKIITDFGGLQREAFFAGKQCVTVFDYIVWSETMHDDRNQLSKVNSEDILDKLNKHQSVLENDKPLGDSYAAVKIVELISNYKG